MAVPKAAVSALVKALSIYMRDVPALDLPPDVRRVRNFHPKALMAHAGEIVALLDDETSRGLVLQWLDEGEHTLPKRQERTLRLAVERPDGWEEELAALAGTARPAPKAPASDVRAALQREAGKAAAAKEEARRVKEASRKSLEEERAAKRELRGELDAARRAVEEAGAEAARARADAEGARASLEKSERKARKDVAAAKAAQQEAAAQLRAVRKELSAARRKIVELEQSLEKATRPRPPRRTQAAEPRGPRRQLRVPAGRLADDPMTLDAWLDAPGVHLLVDGYNVAKSPAGFPDLDLPAQRERLVEGLERLTLRKKVPTTVVFDGSDVGPGKSRLARTRVRVEYSRTAETADDHLVAKLAALPPDPVVLVTGDKELQDRAAAEGATIAVAAQLLELTR